MNSPLPPEWGTPVLPTISPRAFWRRGQRGLRRMTKRQRAIFAAVRFEGASYGELAQYHGISVEAVQAELAKALSTLARAVYGHWWQRWWPW
ncbi:MULTISPECIES: sigma factor-like helix-turn-helix DNA-binding protein [unclassified Novosphingobium]|uniref:sigma-70 region 4 domain-containing protein n=1 Tax=unclassified Novosphingobium TaxID=2644732 RepID=UPI0006B9C54E|nr:MULTISPECIES: sigma-70 region 4 domain-containing protein [unclassified Novosphingobium]KPF50379.1 iron dicitrate transport regulator FecR [Novosphingobium sp. AAP1]MBB3360381.1 DNA-directed RNA polymerase specialized sigma24 family protein [Novosphingobium sp. BK256]MBB3376720.1 DNA-directed RNA polymerase specialized sigma24 family protein [Novosphingobium sp. BK280]MBB3381133.1 DNA-directed RNA polymerase specialized sigma24 family protein [Novosphingobium sp. BK258]MBB3422784.1 DNA-dire